MKNNTTAPLAQAETHTPGPWVASFICGETYVNGGNNSLICDLTDSSRMSLSEKRSNARLISAAPELLEALKEFVRLNDRHSGRPPVNRLLECVDIAKDAIAKATGGSK